MTINYQDKSEITIDLERNLITIYGVCYSLQCFEYLGLGPIGTWLRIVKREDGVVTLERGPGGEDPPEEEAVVTMADVEGMTGLTDEMRGIRDDAAPYRRLPPRSWPDGHD